MLNFAVALITMFFMLKNGHRLRDPVVELVPLKKAETERILDRIRETVRAVFVGVVLVSLLQGVLCGIAYACLGVPSPILWGIVTILICMIPLLGAPAGYVPVSLYLFFDGRWVQGVILLGIGFGIISNVDNFVRPIVIGNRTELPYIAIFFGLLGGVFAFGAVGIVAGPVIISVSLSLIQIWRERVAAGAPEPAAA
jgi:predicted PurR-regulated permease PerM